ncbi:hypothetical protein DL93DRAFT_2050663 [Clavulina sp. PMI_390]|nr:hypothetical protein DL93DRAFT_2050663 [Clavulina sp. PMI_390]
MAALQNLTMRISETISESTRDMSFIGKSANAEYFDGGEEKMRKIKKQLDSTSEREILDAMKRLVALISKGRNVSEFFAQVVKNVGTHHLETRKLVYIYLIRYADLEPDLALLSINTFQKDLSDSNPLIRAMALRVLSSIHVPMIGSIVVLGIKKCASDLSPYVRKAAALAIPKCYELDPSNISDLMDILRSLLKERSPLAIGAVAVAFNALCPTRLDLLHQQYRRLCRILGDADEWGQVQLLDLLSRYARVMLRAPSDDGSDIDPDLQLLLDSCGPLFHSRNIAVTIAVVRICYYLGPAPQRSKVVAPLLNLMHLSGEIERAVLGNCLAISQTHPDLLRPHTPRFVVRASDIPASKRIKVQILTNLVNLEWVDFLINEFTDYAMDADDGLVGDAIRAIGQCAHLVPDTIQHCCTALMNFMSSRRDGVVGHAVLVLKSLYQQVDSSAPGGSFTGELIIASLAPQLGSIRHPAARACVLWLVGQYARTPAGSTTATVIPGMHDWAPDVLRIVAKSFSDETEIVQLQALTLAAKLLVISPPTSSTAANAVPLGSIPTPASKASKQIALLAQYVFAQAAISPNHYDVRDRARSLGALLRGVNMDVYRASEEDDEGAGGVTLRVEQVRLVLFEGKTISTVSGSSSSASALEPGSSAGIGGVAYPLGTMGSQVGRTLFGAEDRVLRFPAGGEGTDSSLRAKASGGGGSAAGRQREVLTPTSGPSGVTDSQDTATEEKRKKWDDLDAFYGSGSEGEEEEEEEEDSEEEEEESGEEQEGEGGEEESEEEEGEEEEDDEESEEGSGDGGDDEEPVDEAAERAVPSAGSGDHHEPAAGVTRPASLSSASASANWQ